MIRSASLLASLPLFACASAPSSDLVAGQPLMLLAAEPVAESGPTAPAVAPEAALPASTLVLGTLPADSKTSFAVSTFNPALYPAVADEGLRHSRTTIKAGVYSSEDADELDDGLIINVSWMRFFTSIFALELEAGYLDTDGSDGGVDSDLWGAPLMVNGRLNLPVWVLDLYGGVGVGTIYYNLDVDTEDDDGFLLGGNAFLGATVNVADSIALGLEAKYYATEDIDDFDVSLESFALMLTLGFSR